MLSPLKRSIWGKLHYWFCLKLLRIYFSLFFLSFYNVSGSGVNEYLLMNIFNSNNGIILYNLKGTVLLTLERVNKPLKFKF